MIAKKYNEQSESFTFWKRKTFELHHYDSDDRERMYDKCDAVTNDKFMETIFQLDGQSTDYSPLVCSIKGDPSSAAWIAQEYPASVTSEQLNWYFAPSLFSKDSDGKFHAKAKLAKSVHCIVLDDVGQRLSFEGLKACMPTWVIQTSPSSYQVGFAFNEPQTDLLAVEKFKTMLINEKLCDPGASGASARWARLPIGINGKPKYGSQPHSCELVWWAPHRRYPIWYLMERLDIRQFSPLQMGSLLNRESKPIDFLGSDSKSTENPVITKLKSLGLYKHQTVIGTHEITCPWVVEHTDQVDHGTAYFEPSSKFMSGGFKCHHGHGSKISLNKFLEEIDVTQSEARNLPQVVVRAGDIPRIVESVEKILADEEVFFIRGGVVVSLYKDTFSSDLEVRTASHNSLLRALSFISTWLRWKKDKFEVCDPSNKYIDLILDGQKYVHLKELKSISRQPFFRADGSLVKQPGYDQVTGVYCDFDKDLYDINTEPTLYDAKSALAELRTLLNEFSFAEEADLSAALSAIMTGVLRQTLSSAPMFHIKAPQIASGKSYLTDLISSFATPRTPSAYAYPATNEECQKLLLSILITSPAVVVFDNLSSDLLAHNTMCSVLTQEKITGRILGISKVATVGTQVLFLSSGNNVGPVQDMNRRVVTISLDPRIETPATKVYAGNPVKTVKSRREHYVQLVLTIELAYIAAGRPQTQCKPLNGYEEWTSFVRQPLLWLGLRDPASRLFKQLEEDPGKDVLGRVLVAWLGEFGSVPKMIRDVCQRTDSSQYNHNRELREVLMEVCEEQKDINRRKLGTWISRNEGRIVGGLRFQRGDGHTAAQQWCVKSVKSVKSVANASFEMQVNEEILSNSDDSSDVKFNEDRIF